MNSSISYCPRIAVFAEARLRKRGLQSDQYSFAKSVKLVRSCEGGKQWQASLVADSLAPICLLAGLPYEPSRHLFAVADRFTSEASSSALLRFSPAVHTIFMWSHATRLGSCTKEEFYRRNSTLGPLNCLRRVRTRKQHMTVAIQTGANFANFKADF
jgi:hypothetical protein